MRAFTGQFEFRVVMARTTFEPFKISEYKYKHAKLVRKVSNANFSTYAIACFNDVFLGCFESIITDTRREHVFD